jgi:diacylglycerol O-acyltransferase / wax synthase
VELLTPEDTAILDLESPTIAGHTCKVVIFETGTVRPDIDLLRSHVEDRLNRVPRCCERLSFDPEPAWADPAPVAIDQHVRLAADGEDLSGAVARAMSGRLDRSRPLWDLVLLPDAGDGRSALVWRVHHAMADGMTMMRWASDLLWDEPPTAAPAAKVAAPPTPTSLASAVAGVARTALSLGKELRPAREAGPFGGRVGTRRQAAFARCSLSDLRTIEHGVGNGVTVNDVVLTAVAGALRTWCERHGSALEGVRVKVPVSMHVHGPDAADLGNLDSFMFVDLPLDEPDPVARLHAVNSETRERKTRHDAEAVYDVLGAVEKVAPPVARVAERWLTNPREFTLNVSNVPGPRSPISVLGQPVEHLYSFAEVAPRHPVRIAVVSLCDAMQFGVLTDPDLVPRSDTIATGIESSIEELLSAVARRPDQGAPS